MVTKAMTALTPEQRKRAAKIAAWHRRHPGASHETDMDLICDYALEQTAKLEAAREHYAKIAEGWAAHRISGIILGDEAAVEIPHDGDAKAPMVVRGSATEKLVNEFIGFAARGIAKDIRTASLPSAPAKTADEAYQEIGDMLPGLLLTLGVGKSAIRRAASDAVIALKSPAATRKD